MTHRLLGGSVLALACALAGCASHPAPATAPSRFASSPRNTVSPAVRQLRSDLAQVFGAPIMARGLWAVDIRSLDSGERLFELNADKLMMPASNMKVLTLATAAEALGWDFRFKTTLEICGSIREGVLQGDLIVRGTGDPTINNRNNRAAAVFDDWAAALRDAGVREIAGRIIGDDQAFDEQGLGDGWSWDYLQFGYAAPVGALQVNENVARLAISPAAIEGDPAIVVISPGGGFTVVNRAVTTAAGVQETLGYRRHFDSRTLEVTGTTPVAGRTINYDVAVANPTLFFAQTLKDALLARGISVPGPAVDFDDVAMEFANGGPERQVLIATESPTLNEIGTVLMKASQNLYAETLVKAIAASRGGIGTTAAGRSAMRTLLTDWGIPEDAYVIADGSGLSRYNYVSAGTMTTVLEHIYRDERHRDPFLATLPIAGKDGTVASRMRRTRAEGNALAKTGSIANVRSLSGFVRTRDDEVVVFSILANDFVIPAATVNYIADLAVETLSNFTRK